MAQIGSAGFPSAASGPGATAVASVAPGFPDLWS
jgi:hypothetical protein